jgi:hypothetical protein
MNLILSEFLCFSHLYDEFHHERKNIIVIAKKVIEISVFTFKILFVFLDETIIDPVYETLREAAETRKRTVANYIQQRQQSLNKQTSLNSQGSSELDIQPSPRVVRHSDGASSSQPQASSLASSGKQTSVTQYSSVVNSNKLSRRNNK